MVENLYTRESFFWKDIYVSMNLEMKDIIL